MFSEPFNYNFNKNNIRCYGFLDKIMILQEENEIDLD